MPRLVTSAMSSLSSRPDLGANNNARVAPMPAPISRNVSFSAEDPLSSLSAIYPPPRNEFWRHIRQTITISPGMDSFKEAGNRLTGREYAWGGGRAKLQIEAN